MTDRTRAVEQAKNVLEHYETANALGFGEELKTVHSLARALLAEVEATEKLGKAYNDVCIVHEQDQLRAESAEKKIAGLDAEVEKYRTCHREQFDRIFELEAVIKCKDNALEHAMHIMTMAGNSEYALLLRKALTLTPASALAKEKAREAVVDAAKAIADNAIKNDREYDVGISPLSLNLVNAFSALDALEKGTP